MNSKDFLQLNAPAGSAIVLSADDPLRCPGCGDKPDVLSQLNQSTRPDKRMLMLCACCGHIGVFLNGRIHTMEGEELRALMHGPQGPIVQNMQRAIRLNGPIGLRVQA